MKIGIFSPRVLHFRTKAIIACCAMIIILVILYKPTPKAEEERMEVLEQRIETTVTQLIVLLQNDLNKRIREKVTMRLLISDSAVVLEDCHQVIIEINKRYSEQSAASKDDLPTKQAAQNLLFQESIAILSGDPEFPRIQAENIMITELQMNMIRYSKIVYTLKSLESVPDSVIMKFDDRINNMDQQLLILNGDFKNMQNAVDKIGEIHTSLSQVVNAI